MTTRNTDRPVPWPGVLLAAIPGLWFALTRAQADMLAPLVQILGSVYILLLLIVVPVMWWRRRQFPVWALVPAGLSAWFVAYFLGRELARLTGLPGNLGSDWSGVALGTILVNVVLAASIFAALLPEMRVRRAAWALLGIMVLGGFLLSILSLFFGPGSIGSNGPIRPFLDSVVFPLSLPAEALMLVAIGLLAARQHKMLALLVVVGGYGYMFTDNDYLFGYPSSGWTLLPLYLLSVTALYLVVVPVGMLRSTSHLGFALAVFGPVVAFLVVRLAVPLLVAHRPLAALRPGELVGSTIILLGLILAWLLYTNVGAATAGGGFTGRIKDSEGNRIGLPS